jgi:hypothetical protein
MATFLILAPTECNMPNRMYSADLPVKMQTGVDQGILGAIAEFVDGLVMPAD